MSRPDYTKFDEDMRQSLLLPMHLSDFRYVAVSKLERVKTQLGLKF